MTKSKMKKIVSSALVANLVIGSVITALPTQGAALENTPVGTSAENKIVSNLKATQNILKNTSFASTSTGITDWNVEQNSYSVTPPSVISPGTKGSDGWFNFGRTSIRPLGNGSVELHGTANSVIGVSQIINTIPGQTYTLSYDYNTTRFTTKAALVGTATYTEFIVSTSGVAFKSDSYPSGGSAGSRAGTSLVGKSGTITETFVATGKQTKVFIGGNLNSADKTNELFQTISNVQVLGTSTTQLDAPTLQPVKNKDLKITGSLNGSIDTLQEVQIYKNDVYVGTATVSGRNFEMTVSPSNVGDVYKAYAVDVWNVKSNPATQTVTASIVAPPTINAVTTDDTTVRGTGIPGKRVYYKVGSAAWGESNYATVAADGTYVFYISQQQVGTQISVKHTVDGVDSALATITVTQGTVAAPTISAVTTDDTTVKGTGINGATVTVTIGSQNYTATVSGGAYSVTIPKQAVGTEITAKQTLNSKTSSSVNTTVTQGTVATPTINAVTTDDTTVKGTGINGATVTITIGSNTYTGTVTDGEYAITIPKQTAGTVVSAKQTLNSKTSSSVATTVTQGSIPAPTIHAVTTDSTTVTGTGVADATVTLTIGGIDYTGTVDADGNYAIAILKQAVGTIITATETLNGITSGPTIATVTQGTVAAPTLNSLTTEDTITRGTGITGATVTITIGSNTYTGTVTDGEYAITIPKQAAGTVVSAKQTLNSKTSSSVTTTVTQGSLAAPTIHAVTTDSTTVTGTGVAGATVTLTIGGIDYTGTVDADGNYAIAILKQAVGTIITATETLNGITSGPTITTVTQGTVAAPTLNSLTTEDTTARGTGITGAVVTITIGSNTYTGTVSNGEYAITIPKQVVGTVVSAKQTLHSKTSSSVNTTVTQGAIAAPTISAVTTDDTSVKGTGVVGATVTITIGSNTYTGTVAANGSYAITIPKQPFGTTITAKQALNGKTSTNTSITVTQGVIAAPTISAVTTDDTSVKGTGVVGATVTITIGSNTYTGTVAANGSYAITIPKQPFGTTITAKQALNGKTSTNASTTVTGTGITGAVVTLTIGTNTYTGTVTGGNYTITIPKQATGTAISAKQTLNSQTSTSVTTTVTSTETTLTANNFTIGTDNYIRGTYTGSSVAKLAIEVNGTVQQQITATGSPYQYYAKGKVTAATDEVYVISYNANGDQLKRVKVGVKALTSGTITPDTFYVGTDNYVTGTLTGDVSKISLTINGVETTKINVTTAPTFRYYANNLIRSLTDIVTVNGYDSAGELLDSKPVTVSQDRGNPGTITSVTPFKIGKDSYINGTYTGDIAKVELQVNDTVLQRINVAADGTIKYYAKGKITETTDVVKLVGYNAAGVAVSTKVVTISDADGSITVNPYVIGTDSYVKGTYTGDVAKISLTVNGDKKTTITVPTPGPNYQYYAKSLITEATDIVVVTAYDATGGVLDTKTVAVSKPTVVTTGTVTPSAYKIGTNTYVDGTYTGDVAKVAVEVNGVLSNPIPATGNVIHYYAGALITDKDDVVYAIVYDATGKELDKKRVTITAPEGTVTANTLKTTDSYLTGSATGDVAKVTLTVNDVKQASITVVQADSTYRYYVKPLALTSTDIVKVIGLDSRGNEITTATVTITN
ncbi:beta strand repeat-containing protein [Listeria booriae]|uniref:beta strand repeat-containing protein n=1 Tax=Listeria booriae TaxID=1552123 RepID=UPI00162AAC48|nr:immunoglobulin-like domain-containing protein [Listeria booriae]MBC2257062.1 hypothetical protein [Listeria booriae]